MTRVAFRCDARRAGGIGHLVRCISLAEECRERGWAVGFIGDIATPVARDLVASVGGEILGEVAADDAVITRSVGWGASVLHIDDYAQPDRLREFAATAGILLSAIADGPFGVRPADVMFDVSPWAPERSPASASSFVFRGLPFAPLRRSVRASARAAWPLRSRIDTVLVLMGGTDAHGVSQQVVDLLLRSTDARTIKVVDVGDVLADVSFDQRVVLTRPGMDVLELLDGVDLAVTASGTSVWEFAALGVPVAVVQVAENQHDNYTFVTEHGIGLGLSSAGGLVHDALGSLDLAKRSASAIRGRALVDAAGAQRIVDAWERLVPAANGTVTARGATMDDARALFEWRNDRDVRSASRATGELTWENHVGWLADTLERDDRVLTVVELAGASVGTVRFDAHEDGAWEVSITVNPQFRGRRIAGAILASAVRCFDAARDRQVDLVAVMRETNHASARLFGSLGFVCVGETDGWRQTRLSRIG